MTELMKFLFRFSLSKIPCGTISWPKFLLYQILWIKKHWLVGPIVMFAGFVNGKSSWCFLVYVMKSNYFWLKKKVVIILFKNNGWMYISGNNFSWIKNWYHKFSFSAIRIWVIKCKTKIKIENSVSNQCSENECTS